MQLHTITRTETRSKLRIGRGGKRGKTGGRGTKGQSARAGNKKRPEWRDAIKKLPKLRGHGKNRARTVFALRPRPNAISLKRIEAVFNAQEVISPQTLVEKGLITDRGGKLPMIKLVGNTVSKAFTINNCAVTAGAKSAIEKAGGAIK